MTLDELKAVRDRFTPYVKAWKRNFHVRIKMQLPREHRSLDIERSERAKNIIELHHGKLLVESELDKGTEFKVVFEKSLGLIREGL